MTRISPEAQTLINRLARMDPAAPRRDKAVIERAIAAHLAALGLPQRPVAWAEDAQAGFRHVAQAVRGDLASRLVSRATWALRSAEAWEKLYGDAGWHAAHDMEWRRSIGEAREAAAASVDKNEIRPAWDLARAAARADVWDLVFDLVKEEAWTAAGESVRDTLTNVSLDAALEAAEDVASTAAWIAALVDRQAVQENPPLARQISIDLPIFDAFEAGLFLCVVRPFETICVLQPSLSLENGLRYRADGPTVS